MAKKKQSPKVKLSELVSSEFNLALQTLINSDKLSASVSFEIIQVFEQVTKLQAHYEQVREGLLKKYGKKAADGSIEMNEAKTQFVLEDREGFNRDYQELLGVTVTVPKIPMTYIKDVHISPVSLAVLLRTVVSP